jgi:hypothetical protein
MHDSINNSDKLQSDSLFKIWNITNFTLDKNITDIHYLLNNSNINNYDNIEKYVHDISLFHMKDNFIDFDKNTHNIEFSIETDNNTFKVDYNKKNKSYPLFSIITFLDENCNPIILTYIDMESYKYKEIADENQFLCFKPMKHTQIVFDSSKYYGFYKMNEYNGRILKINIWDIQLENIPIYVSNAVCYNNCNEIGIELLQNNICYETVDYKNMINLFLYEDFTNIYILDNIIKKYADNSIITINNTNKNYVDINYLKEKYNDIADEIYPFVNKNNDIYIENNRFCKNKIVQNILSKDVCYWIINECENFEWGESNYINYNNYINIEKIPSILNFLLFVSNFWLIEIKKLYNCENIKLNIYDIFVSKYTKEMIDNTKNIDNSFLTLTIYLNNSTDYKNGEIIFENNEKIMINQGDMLIYNGKQLRTKGNVSDGVKYVLVLMIEIKV